MILDPGFKKSHFSSQMVSNNLFSTKLKMVLLELSTEKSLKKEFC